MACRGPGAAAHEASDPSITLNQSLDLNNYWHSSRGGGGGVFAASRKMLEGRSMAGRVCVGTLGGGLGGMRAEGT